jgi:hypothetical protein
MVFRMTSSKSGSNMPFAFGHVFREGDIPSGSVARSTLADWQCSPLTFWPDGSLKHAIVAGRATFTAGIDTALALSSGSPSSVTPMSEADLAAAMPNVVIAAGGFSWTLNASVGTADLRRTVCAGPVMSNFIYRKPIAGSSWLVLWADVRIYKGGSVEIFPWVESAALTQTSVSNDVRTYSVTIGTSQVFSQSIDVKALTRVALLGGSTFSYWTPSDPQILPKHDRAYAMSTRMVPNFGWVDPASSVLDSLHQTYASNDVTAGGQISSAMASAGGRGSPFDANAAMYVRSNGDARAYRAMLAFALSSGGWSSHHRDSTTHEPIKFTSYPNVQIDGGQGTPAIAHETNIAGGRNGLSGFTHLPSYGYAAFLFTGRWWFFEEVLMWATSSYLYTQTGPKQNARNIIDPNNGYFDRGAAWAMTALWHSLALCPADYPLFADLKASMEANMSHYRGKYVDGTIESGKWVNPMGWFAVTTQYNSTSEPATNARRAGIWQDAYLKITLGLARAAGLPLSAQAKADLVAVTNKGYQAAVDRAGDGQNGRPNWRHLTAYDYPVWTPYPNTPGTWLTADQGYASWLSRNGLSPIPANAGLSLKRVNGVDDLVDGESSVEYFDVQFAVLALATEHGLPGAREGYQRVTGASNFAALSNYFRGGRHPYWAGYAPRN